MKIKHFAYKSIIVIAFGSIIGILSIMDFEQYLNVIQYGWCVHANKSIWHEVFGWGAVVFLHTFLLGILIMLKVVIGQEIKREVAYEQRFN